MFILLLSLFTFAQSELPPAVREHFANFILAMNSIEANQSSGFGNSPSMGGGFAGGLGAFGGFEKKCRVNSYAYVPGKGFGFYFEKGHGSDPSPNKCVFYRIQTHGYETVDMYEGRNAVNCLTKSHCQPISEDDGQTIVSIICPPLDFNGQKIVAAFSDLGSQDVKTLIRSEEPTKISKQSYKDRRDQLVKKSKYVEQSISRDYLFSSVLRDNNPEDLMENPREVMNRINDEEQGMYITSPCDPRSTEEPPFYPGYGGGMLNPGTGGFGGPGYPPPGTNGAR